MTSGRGGRRHRGVAMAALSPAGASTLLVATTFAATALLVATPAAAATGRLVYLAFDGLGAAELEAWMANGVLPELTDLRANGGYARMLPSPLASEEALWATFAIGAGAGHHGLFDFTVPDFATYRPTLADSETLPPSFHLKLLRKEPPRATSRRQGTPFWKLLDAHEVEVELLFLPFTFPPDTLRWGRMIAGIGTPDLRLTRSTFTVLTAGELGSNRVTVPGGQIVKLRARGNEWVGEIEGPPDPRVGEAKRLTVPVIIRQEANALAAKIQIGGIRRSLRQGEWAGLVPVTFSFSPLYKVNGWVRPYLLAADPLSVYFSPVNIDFEKPYLPFCYPNDFARHLSSIVGPFETLGWIEDTFALNAGVLKEKPFAECVMRGIRHRITLVEREIERRDWDFLAAAFLSPDRVAHTFTPAVAESAWAAGRAPAGTGLESIARHLDELVGAVRLKLTPEDRLVVFSTHGMSWFRTGLNLNTWLEEEGYLVASEDGVGGTSPAGAGLAGVDWSRTRAYALGYGAIYLNRTDREAQGTVTPAAAGPLAEEIAAKLAALVDPERKIKPILKVLRGSVIFNGPLAGQGPDLVVVYRDGYSTSWSSLLGNRPAGRFARNSTRWTGEHAAADPERVAGFVIADRPLAVADPSVADLTATALAHFGAGRPPIIEGRPLF
jgi:predicted AlkP superfamily phosphohydrolase/phosphomutase